MDGHTPINRFLRVLNLYCIGGVVYALIEIMWRGYTHWSMVILGGLCFLLIGGINEHIEWEEPLWSQMLKGSIIITILEFSGNYYHDRIFERLHHKSVVRMECMGLFKSTI